VFGAMLGGFLAGGGNLLSLLAGSEFILILGMAFGAMVISTPRKILTQCFSKASGAFKGSHFTKQAYVDALAMMFKLFSMARKNGLLALESHISDPEKSEVMSKYPSVLENKPALNLLIESLRLIVDGSVQPEELDFLMESSIETFEAEGHMPLSAWRAMGDGLPGLGIVGAVLGIIITMSHMDGPPSEVGEHVASALVGTFMGVFVAYGIVNPMVSLISQQDAEEVKFMNVIRSAVKAYVTGSSPSTAVEFARQAIFSFDKPSAAEIERVCKKGG